MGLGSERRLSERRDVPVLVARGPQLIAFGCTRDLSETGMYVRTEDRPGIGDVDDVHVNWGHDLVSCQARIVRHGNDGVGLTFVGLDPMFRYVLAEMLATGV